MGVTATYFSAVRKATAASARADAEAKRAMASSCPRLSNMLRRTEAGKERTQKRRGCGVLRVPWRAVGARHLSGQGELLAEVSQVNSPHREGRVIWAQMCGCDMR